MCLQTEMKIKVLEAKHQEEKLKMQQRHDADVEKVRIKTEELNTRPAAAAFEDGYFASINNFLASVWQ